MELLIVLRRESLPNPFKWPVECAECCTCYLSVWIFSLSVSVVLTTPRSAWHGASHTRPHSSNFNLDSIQHETADTKISFGGENQRISISIQIDLHQQVTIKLRCDRHSDCSCHWIRVGVVIVLWLCGAGVSPCQTGDWLSEDTRLPGGQRIEARVGRCGTSTEDTLWVKCNTRTQPHVRWDYRLSYYCQCHGDLKSKLYLRSMTFHVMFFLLIAPLVINLSRLLSASTFLYLWLLRKIFFIEEF